MPDPDTERAAINAAMNRLLDGTPQRSTGALSILQLANEAGVKRWVLTHKHTDLAAEFRRRARHTDGIPPAFSGMETRLRELERANTALREQNSHLRAQVDTYARVIHELHTTVHRALQQHRRGGAGNSGRARRVHDDRDPGQADQRADHVEAVGAKPVGGHTPQQRPGHEHSAVGGQDAPEVRVRLQRGDEPVQAQGDDTGTDPRPPLVLAYALPYQPGPADLGDGGQGEQQNRAQHGHARRS